MPKRTKKLSSEKIAALEDPELAVGEQLQNYLAIVSIVSKVYASATVLSRIENHGITNGILINDGHVKTVLGFKRIQRHEQKTDIDCPHIQMGVGVLKGILAETNNIADSGLRGQFSRRYIHALTRRSGLGHTTGRSVSQCLEEQTRRAPEQERQLANTELSCYAYFGIPSYLTLTALFSIRVGFLPISEC